MTTLYICRHGETENNKNHRLSGWMDTPLTTEGKQNALSSAAKLSSVQLDRVVSSDLGRAFMTAYIIARQLGYSAEIETVEGLREINYGDLANQPYAAYPDISPQENAGFVPPNGESLNQMQARVLQTVEQLTKHYEGQTVLLVAHDGTINALKANYHHTSMGVADTWHNPHDFVAKFDWRDGQVTAFNELS